MVPALAFFVYELGDRYMTEQANSTAVRLNRGVLWLSKKWLAVVLFFLGLFVSGPFLAPTLMHFGYTAPARVIYTAYSIFCHQYGFRSFFLFGEQSVYPRENTGTTLVSYEVMIAEAQPAQFAGIGDLYAEGGSLESARDWARFQLAARAYPGNDTMGYKMTICERDISIYMALFVGGLLYGLTRKRVRPVPIWLYLLLGIGPIGIDGFSQLLSYPPFGFWPVRETLPFFRVLTGALFGFMNAWLAFPYLELSFRETRESIEAKFERAGLAV